MTRHLAAIRIKIQYSLHANGKRDTIVYKTKQNHLKGRTLKIHGTKKAIETL